MAINLTNTKDVHSNGVKALVYGVAGVGKTTFCSTAPNPVIISAEAGLLSLAGKDIPVIEVKTIDDVREAFEFLSIENPDRFETICLDSVSEIAEVVLHDAKQRSKDPRQAYGELIDRMQLLIRSFRDLPGKNVLMTCKQGTQEDQVTGITRFVPTLPGSRLTQEIPYYFDEVFCMRIGKDDDGLFRYLQTSPDIQYTAKDRSGRLDPVIKPDFNEVLNSIKGI